MPNPKLSTLIDAFTGTSINLGLWNASSGGGVIALDQVNDRALIAVGTTANTFNSLGSNGPYDATSSALYARIGAAPNGRGGVQTVMKLAVDANNSIQAQVNSGSVFLLQVQTAGSYVTTTLPSYDPYQHAWWQLAEAGGNFTFSTSIDGVTWTALATVAHSWSATAMMVFFQTGTTDTEPAGQQAWFAHVNTPLGGQLNPNWPAVEYSWAPYWNCNGAAQPLDRYIDVTSRTRSKAAVQRGRQFELDQVRAGTLDMELVNNDSALDPLNPSGPWYGSIMPYQPARLRAQWPPTINLLTQVQATGGDAGGFSAGAIPQGQQGIGVFSVSDSSGGSIVATATAWQNGRVFQFSVPSGTATGTAIGYSSQTAITPGGTYTVQAQVRNVTASTTLQVCATLNWYMGNNNSGTPSTITNGTAVTLTGSATAGWTQVTVTATVPAGAYALAHGVRTAGAPSGTCSIQLDGWQLEKGSQASAWTMPGTWSPIYSGFVERFPSSWKMSGTYGLVSPTAVDTFSLLSQRVLRDPLTEEIYSRNPRFLFTLADPQGSQTFADAIGAYPPAPLAVSKYGAGTLTSGNQITSTIPGRTYTGSTGTVVTVSNPGPGTNLIEPATYISLGSSGIKGPTSPNTWTRMIAFRYTGPAPTTGNNACLWSSLDQQRASGNPSGSRIDVRITDQSKPLMLIQGPSGAGAGYYAGGATNVVDGNWHLLLFGYSSATAQVMVSQDGAGAAFYGSVPSTYTPTGLVSDNVGGFVDPTDGNGTIYNYQGDISFVAEWPFLFSSADIITVYTAWKNSFTGDSSDARYNRILGWAGFSGPTSIQSGMTASMGAAAVGGQDALSALQAVVDTESGAHFVDTQGWVTFKARSDRYNKLTPVYVFGERTDLGEIPYEDLGLDYDPTRLANQVKVTQASSGQVFSAQDTTSITNFFPRQLTRTVNSSSTQECQDAANYLLSRFKNPAVRVSNLRLHPSANPSVLWPVCLSLELGTRVRVMRRPPAPAAPIQVDCFVENIIWELGDDGNSWVTLQCSPVDTTPYGLFAAFHTTLNATVSSGVGSIVIKNAPGQDNTDPAAAQIPVGGQLILGLGTANQETVTIQSVGATTAGWTTATITLTANTTKSHTAGDTVCEALPAGVTDPTTWDTVSTLDAHALAY